MNTLRTLGHIMAKDLRRIRWALLVYLVLIAATAGDAVWPGVEPRVLMNMARLIMVGGALLIVAVMVQEDSPVRADAYWLSRPLPAWLVVLSKLGVAIVIVAGAAVVAEWTTLALLDLLLPGYAYSLMLSFGEFVLFLLGITVIASATRDLKTALAVCVALPLVLIFSASGVFGRAGSIAGTFAEAALIGGTIGMVATLALLYLRRDRRLLATILGAVSVYAAAGGLALGELSDTPEEQVSFAEERPVGIDSIGATLPRDDSTVGGNLVEGFATLRSSGDLLKHVHFSNTWTGPERLVVRELSAHTDTAPPGKDVVSRTVPHTIIARGDPTLIRDTRWLNSDSSRNPYAQVYATQGWIGERRDVRVARYSGRVDRLTPRVLFEVPARDTGTHLLENMRIKVTPARGAGPLHLFDVTAASISASQQEMRTALDSAQLSWVLFNAARNEALFLRMGVQGGASEILVTPWLNRRRMRLRLAIDSATNAGIDNLAAWLQQATLAIVAWDRVASHRLEYQLPEQHVGSAHRR